MLKRGLQQYAEQYLQAVRKGLVGNVSVEARDHAAAYARTLLENGLPVIFDQHHLAYVTRIRSQVIGAIRSAPSRFYTEFRIAKRTGGSRAIAAPTPALKTIQDWLHTYVTSRFATHLSCHGFVRGRSIFTNAEPHVRAPIILKLDVRDFFGSVERSRVFTIFRQNGYSQ